jgi:hypothetical protein
LGLGVYYKGGSYMRYETFKAKPGVILLFEPDIAFAKELRNLFPKAFIVGRRDTHARNQALDNPSQRGADYADFVAEKAAPLKDVVDAWVSYNEPVKGKDFNAYRAYNEFQVAFANKLQNQYGVAAVAGNDAPGAIDINEYPQYFAEAIRASKYLGIHAYTTIKATTFREKDVDWYILRYRKYHEALEAAGIKDVKMVLTEVAFVDGWQRRGITADQMAAEYLWLADEMYKDPYAVGYAAYGLWVDPGQWFTYQLAATRVLDMMGAYQPPAGVPVPR